MSEAYRLTELGSIPRAPKSPKHLCECNICSNATTNNMEIFSTP